MADVTFIARAGKPVDVLDEKYTSGLFTASDSLQFDSTNEMRAQWLFNVFQYLQGLIAMMQITQTETGGWRLYGRGSTPKLFVDEMRTDAEVIQTLDLANIAYVKVFRPPFFGSPTGAGGAIAVYIRKASDIKPVTNEKPDLNYKYVKGYSAFKQFYTPDYSDAAQKLIPDVRTTICWKPYVLTDGQNKKIQINFYNNDITKKLRVVIEGVNALGKLTRTEKIIE